MFDDRVLAKTWALPLACAVQCFEANVMTIGSQLKKTLAERAAVWLQMHATFTLLGYPTKEKGYSSSVTGTHGSMLRNFVFIFW